MLTVGDTGFEKVNAKGIELNKEITDAFLDVEGEIDPQAHAKSITIFDKRHPERACRREE